MTRKLVVIGLLATSIIATAALVMETHASYFRGEGMGKEMENIYTIYISRIFAFGVPILLLQIAAVVLVISGNGTKNAP